MGKLFGTDGIRGVAGTELTAELAYGVGRSLAATLPGEHLKVVIGRDTRISCDMLESALVAGLCSMGADVLLLGVIPTPAVAYLTVSEGADAGIMVSASHNPFEHNGIKVFSSRGFKLSDELEDVIERELENHARHENRTGAALGKVLDCSGLCDKYTKYLRSTVSADLSKLRVAVDCANGSASATARRVFDGLCHAAYYFDTPDGTNINQNCGSTHLSALGEIVKSGGFDVGVAFDGDADRCLIISEAGNDVDGDRIMAICGGALRERGELPFDTIVATVMSNLGFHVYCRERGIKVITAPVGDRYVLEEMQKGGFSLGGEQSGHLIFTKHLTTGDGQLSALQFLSVLAESGLTVSKLVAEIPMFPQVLINIAVRPDTKAGLSADERVKKVIVDMEKQLGDDGRILVRPSGTEPLVRVMTEGRDKQTVEFAAQSIADVIKSIAT